MKNGISILITPIYSVESIIACIVKYKIEKILLLVDKDLKEKQKESIELLTKTFEKSLSIVQQEIDLFNILEIATETIRVINDYSSEYDIILNISTGKRTQAIGMIYGSTAVTEKVSKIVYYNFETAEIFELPILSLGLSDMKNKILNYVKQSTPIERIQEETGKSKSMIYSHIRDLKNIGYIDDEGKLTEIGKILVN